MSESKIQHREAVSAIQRLGRFSPPMGLPLEEEEPLFAATADFAAEFGGPITRLFVESLPQDWGSLPLVIDTMLVWLTVGTYAGPIRFHREPYPLNDLGAFDMANADRGVDHINVVIGPAGIEALIGVLPLGLPDKPLRADQAAAMERDTLLRGCVDRGELSVASINPSELFRSTAETFVRHIPAERAGFHFFMRATRGSRQPLVNGFRTITKG